MKAKHLELILAGIAVFRGLIEVIEEIFEKKAEVEDVKTK